MKYPCKLLPGESGEGGFTVVFPDLPGCITEGDTLEEALQMARDAMETWLDGTIEDGEVWPRASRRITAGSGEIVYWFDIEQPQDKAA